jgi:hypothetical protein
LRYVAQVLYHDLVPTISTTDAAQLIDPPVTRHTVEREIRRGNLTAEKTAGQWIINDAEARRWAASFVKHREQRTRTLQPEQAPPGPDELPAGGPPR